MIDEEKDDNVPLNDFSSNLSGMQNDKNSFNKTIIIISVVSVIFIILLVLLIVLLNKSSSDEKDEKDNPNENKEVIGNITCVYQIDKTNEEVKILGDNFKKPDNFDIYVNGGKINYCIAYKFPKLEENTIEFILYENLNMDEMFSNVPSLKSVKMSSNKNCKILSMISTFENCNNLESFNIDGFSTDELKSTKKLFYNTNLNNLNMDFLKDSNIAAI